MLISTMNDVPGYRVVEVKGEVFGITVRSRNAFSNIGASFKALKGGELKGLTKNVALSRDEVIERLSEAAEAKGANAVLAMRFDSGDIGDLGSEVCAYGTAVVIEPLT